MSVVVPVFNGADHLRESLESILAQTYPDLEVLVMDDASTDATPDVIASFGDRVRGIRQATNKGIYGNTNDGIAAASGEYIAFYHADDLYDPAIVSSEVEFLERHPEVGAVFCKDILVDASGNEFGRVELPPEVRGEAPLDFAAVFNALLTHKNPFLRCPSAMVRKRVYDEVGVFRDEEFLNTSDLEMWLRLARRHRIAILDRHLFWYRSGHGNSSGRYHHLRTAPNRYFPIMDLYLEQHGGRDVATTAALRAYEGHRAEDRIMRAVSHYVRGDRSSAAQLLGRVHPGDILRGHRLQRGRILLLYLLMQGLARLPRIPWVAEAFYRRWHAARGGG